MADRITQQVVVHGRSKDETVDVVLPFDGSPFAAQVALNDGWHPFDVMHIPTTARVPGAGRPSIDAALECADKLARECPSAALVSLIGDGRPFKGSVPQIGGPAETLEDEIRACLGLPARKAA